MGIGMLLFWGLIITAIAVLARGFGAESVEKSGGNEPWARDKAPLEILGERYARGEIDKSAFENQRRDLARSGAVPMDQPRNEVLKAGGVEAS